MDAVSLSLLSSFTGAVALGGAVHLVRRRARQARDEAAFESGRAAGTNFARSLHPVIDPDICIGSLSCLRACPEGDILGVVNGAARLVHGEHCIGHGRCAAECPVGAIRLVFGSAERGVDLPEVDSFFESSRPGVHIIGELGGMGLIKNAMTQGLQLSERIAAVTSRGANPVVVVGAGPAGIAACVGLKARGVPYRLLEQGSLGGTVYHYPRRKVTMTDVVDLPGYGKFGKPVLTKEELLTSFSRVLARTRVRVEPGVRVTGIAGEPGAFKVETDQGAIEASRVVLAVGRRGTPRRLGVKGEEHEKVVYGFTEPGQYARSKVLVIGGGDAAVEAAIQLAEESDAEVSLSYRGEELTRVRERNRAQIQALAQKERVRMLLPSVVKEVRPKEVVLEARGSELTLPNDFVIVNIGGEMPVEFLGKVGVSLRRYHGQSPGEPKEEEVSLKTQARSTESEKRKRSGKAKGRPARIAYALVGLGILLYLAYVGRDYYPLPMALRRLSPLHERLRPAGPWGHGIGLVATAFMLSNFLYAVRKRFKSLARLGGISRWLDFHVFVGFTSPLVIAFHSAFQSNNLLATVTATSLAIVVSTGLIGRYIYGWVPAESGKALELSDLLGQFERLRLGATDLPAEAAPAAKVLIGRVTSPVRARFLLLVFVAAPFEAIALRVRLMLLRARVGDRDLYRAFKSTVLRLERLRWQIRFYASLKKLLRGWRLFHASLAVLLVLVIAAHIGLSLYLGYGLRFFR